MCAVKGRGEARAGRAECGEIWWQTERARWRSRADVGRADGATHMFFHSLIGHAERWDECMLCSSPARIVASAAASTSGMRAVAGYGTVSKIVSSCAVHGSAVLSLGKRR
jgi:hypothetical protein